MRYFTLQELTRSETAVRLGIDNKPGADEYCALAMLAERVLDPARKALGMPVMVTSGYRSAALNKAVGGVANSQHCKGEAADLYAGSARTNSHLARIIYELGVFDQLILEEASADGTECQWVHVSYCRTRNRGQVLIKVKGRKGYRVFEFK